MAQIQNTFICGICNISEINNLDFGETLKKEDVSVHYFCMLFSKYLPQKGEDEAGLRGFLLNDIRKFIRKYRKKNNCCFCGKDHATIYCAEKNCKKIFHLVCGMKNNCHFQFDEYFSPYCNDHTKMVPVPTPCPHLEICFICHEKMGDNYDLLTWIPSCSKCNLGFLHRNCIKMSAIMSGYYFKCTLCDNKSNYREEVKLMGIYVPDTEATWERPSYYQNEIFYRYCEADVCKCKLGKYHTETSGKWKLDICKFCGHVGMHNGCKVNDKNRYTCRACTINAGSITDNIYTCGFSYQNLSDKSMIHQSTDKNVNEFITKDKSDESKNKENDDRTKEISNENNNSMIIDENINSFSDNQKIVENDETSMEIDTYNENMMTHKNVNDFTIIHQDSDVVQIVENVVEIISVSSKSDTINVVDNITILSESISEGPDVLVTVGKYKPAKFKYESARLQRYKDEVLDGPAYDPNREMSYGCYCENCADLKIYDT